MKSFLTVLMGAVIVLAFAVGLGLLFAYATMWLVNYLFSAAFLTFVFGAAKINFWQAFVINILLGSFSGSRSSSSKD